MILQVRDESLLPGFGNNTVHYMFYQLRKFSLLFLDTLKARNSLYVDNEAMEINNVYHIFCIYEILLISTDSQTEKFV